MALSLLVAWSSTGWARSDPPEVLPDLDEEAPSQLTVKEVRRGARRSYRLGFRSAVVNLGRGPLFIRARASTRTPRLLVAEQVVALADGRARTYSRVGRLAYQRFRDHQHWHLSGFARYELRRASDGALARPDLKQGFCLTDAFRRKGIRGPSELVYEVAHRDSDCGRARPRATYLEEGISVGFADVYEPHLEGQQIDVTGLPGGVYLLVHTANADRRLREARYSNNSASLRLRLEWRRGRARRPRVRILARCPSRPRCAARRQP